MFGAVEVKIVSIDKDGMWPSADNTSETEESVIKERKE